MTIEEAIKIINGFKGSDLTKNLSKHEKVIVGNDLTGSKDFCKEHDINNLLLESATSIKRASSQIDVIIHATGILYCLQHILDDNEVIESASLGAGNTGKKFDLETNLRIAEFKFITWRGGPESIRQNSIFKDFYNLAEYETSKQKFLYLVDTTYPMKFFLGKRKLSSVLHFNHDIWESIQGKYGDNMKVVSDYFNMYKTHVHVKDISKYLL